MSSVGNNEWKSNFPQQYKQSIQVSRITGKQQVRLVWLAAV